MKGNLRDAEKTNQLAWRSGNLLEQILLHTVEENVDAIVLGMRRRHWPTLWPTLADRLLRSASCEVIVVSDAPPRGARRLREWLGKWWLAGPRPPPGAHRVACAEEG